MESQIRIYVLNKSGKREKIGLAKVSTKNLARDGVSGWIQLDSIKKKKEKVGEIKVRITVGDEATPELRKKLEKTMIKGKPRDDDLDQTEMELSYDSDESCAQTDFKPSKKSKMTSGSESDEEEDVNTDSIIAIGRALVEIRDAKNLASKGDIYITCNCGGQIFASSKISGTNSPAWNESFDL